MQSNKNNTTFLNNKLNNSEDIQDFLDVNNDALQMQSFRDLLLQLLEDKNLNFSDVLKNTQLAASTGYQLKNGRRSPSRDKILQLSIGSDFNLFETNRLLKSAGKSELYVKNKRDAIIMFALNKNLSIYDTESLLIEQHQNCLIDSK